MANYNSTYTGTQVDTAVRKGVSRKISAIAKLGDTSDDLVIGSGQVDTFVLLPISLSVIKNVGFTTGTNGVVFSGPDTTDFTFNGVATLGCSVNNTIIHFKLAINGVVKDETESAVKISTNTDLSTINAASYITLPNNALVQVYVKADKACTISAFHTQLTLVEV